MEYFLIVGYRKTRTFHPNKVRIRFTHPVTLTVQTPPATPTPQPQPPRSAPKPSAPKPSAPKPSAPKPSAPKPSATPTPQPQPPHSAPTGPLSTPRLVIAPRQPAPQPKHSSSNSKNNNHKHTGYSNNSKHSNNNKHSNNPQRLQYAFATTSTTKTTTTIATINTGRTAKTGSAAGVSAGRSGSSQSTAERPLGFEAAVGLLLPGVWVGGQDGCSGVGEAFGGHTGGVRRLPVRAGQGVCETRGFGRVGELGEEMDLEGGEGWGAEIGGEFDEEQVFEEFPGDGYLADELDNSTRFKINPATIFQYPDKVAFQSKYQPTLISLAYWIQVGLEYFESYPSSQLTTSQILVRLFGRYLEFVTPFKVFAIDPCKSWAEKSDLCSLIPRIERYWQMLQQFCENPKLAVDHTQLGSMLAFNWVGAAFEFIQVGLHHTLDQCLLDIILEKIPNSARKRYVISRINTNNPVCQQAMRQFPKIDITQPPRITSDSNEDLELEVRIDSLKVMIRSQKGKLILHVKKPHLNELMCDFGTPIIKGTNLVYWSGPHQTLRRADLSSLIPKIQSPPASNPKAKPNTVTKAVTSTRTPKEFFGMLNIFEFKNLWSDAKISDSGVLVLSISEPSNEPEGFERVETYQRLKAFLHMLSFQNSAKFKELPKFDLGELFFGPNEPKRFFNDAIHKFSEEVTVLGRPKHMLLSLLNIDQDNFCPRKNPTLCLGLFNLESCTAVQQAVFSFSPSAFEVASVGLGTKVRKPELLWLTKQQKHISIVVLHNPKASLWLHCFFGRHFMPIGSYRGKEPGLFQLKPNHSLAVVSDGIAEGVLLVEKHEILTHPQQRVLYKASQLDFKF